MAFEAASIRFQESQPQPDEYSLSSSQGSQPQPPPQPLASSLASSQGSQPQPPPHQADRKVDIGDDEESSEADDEDEESSETDDEEFMAALDEDIANDIEKLVQERMELDPYMYERRQEDMRQERIREQLRQQRLMLRQRRLTLRGGLPLAPSSTSVGQPTCRAALLFIVCPKLPEWLLRRVLDVYVGKFAHWRIALFADDGGQQQREPSEACSTQAFEPRYGSGRGHAYMVRRDRKWLR